MSDRWRYFTLAEFDCNCGCDGNEMHPHFIDVLDSFRTLIGSPLTVTSGYRCIDHPIEETKMLPGTHTEGVAVDLAVRSILAMKLIGLALITPEIKGIGIHQRGANRYVHLDAGVDTYERPRPAIWTYS